MASISNYDITRTKMEKEFVRYDQARMIEKFHLRHTPEHLFITFLGEEFRVGRETGKVERCLGDGYAPAGFNESMTIFDVLCCSKPHCRPAASTLRSPICPVLPTSPPPGQGSTPIAPASLPTGPTRCGVPARPSTASSSSRPETSPTCCRSLTLCRSCSSSGTRTMSLTPR